MPVIGGRVTLTLSNGNDLFTGYIVETPTYQYLGWAERGPVYRYAIDALSDVMLMDQKAPPPHPPFVDRSAGSAFEQLTAEALPGWFDVSGVEAGDPIPYYSVDPAKKWTASAAEVALSARCSYRDDNSKLFFAPLGVNTYALVESSATFSPGDLQLQSVNRLVNDLTILGPLEPSAHVKDYFCGDGFTTYFYLSQKPFTRSSQVALYNRTILDEIYTELDPTHWTVTDPLGAITVSNGAVAGCGRNRDRWANAPELHRTDRTGRSHEVGARGRRVRFQCGVGWSDRRTVRGRGFDCGMSGGLSHNAGGGRLAISRRWSKAR